MNNDSPQQEAKDANNKIGDRTISGQRQLKADGSEDANTEPQDEIDNPEQSLRYLPDGISLWWRKLEQHSNQTIAAFTIVIALTGIIYTVFAGAQWGQMKTSNRLNQEALESVQRAFLYCEHIQQSAAIEKTQSGSQTFWNFTMPCENTGTTPGYVVTQTLFAKRLATEPTEDQFAQRVPTWNSVIAPKGAFRVGSFKDTEENWFGVRWSDKMNNVSRANPPNLITADTPPFFLGQDYLSRCISTHQSPPY